MCALYDVCESGTVAALVSCFCPLASLPRQTQTLAPRLEFRGCPPLLMWEMGSIVVGNKILDAPPRQFQPMSNVFKQAGNVTQGQRVLDVCVCVCVCVCGGWRPIKEEGLYGSAGGSERRAPVLQRMTLVVSALAPSVYATLT